MNNEVLAKSEVAPETWRRLYKGMALIREFERSAGRLRAQTRIEGSLHLSIGQEAVSVGVCDVLNDDDLITSTHRGHGDCLAKGADPAQMMAELFGRSVGYCGGRSGSMHMADPGKGILGANAIVGAGMPIAVGSAFASRIRGSGQVTVAFFGEGAVAQGAFHEAMNIAALWKLPVVFVCENNGYAELSHVSLHLAAQTVSDYARGYGIPGITIDGNDAILVRSTAEDAVARARSGEGPTLLECKTYRWQGHFEGDQQRYRTKEEVETWRARDPVQRLAQAWIASRKATEEDVERVDREVKDELAIAVEWAEASAPAEDEAVTANVYRDRAAFVRTTGLAHDSR